MALSQLRAHALSQVRSCATVRSLTRTLASSPAPPLGQSQGQLHRGMKIKEPVRLWPYIKAAKQQFFNVILASLGIVMAVKMLEGKGTRVALEEQIAELERREGVLLGALADERWAEDMAKRIGATAGKEGVLRELGEVVEASMADEESAQLATMRAAALKGSIASEEETHTEPRDGATSSSPRKHASKGMV